MRATPRHRDRAGVMARLALALAVVGLSSCGGGGSSNSQNPGPGPGPGPSGDQVAPTVSISSPTASGAFTTGADSVTIAGTAADNVGVTGVTWRQNGGPLEDAVGTDDWTTPVILLVQGANMFDIIATDAAGNQTTAQITVTFDPALPNVLSGIAVIGDSNSDEYRADDNRGGAYASVTFNWVEQLAMARGLNFGSWGTRASPRRSGFEYNWALSGATTSSMLSRGQHVGVAQQVAAGDVSLVYFFIGWNDWARTEYADVYDGTVSGAALDAKIAGVVNDITTAVDTVLAAGPVSVIVVDFYDHSIPRPRLLANFPDPVRRQVVTDAINTANAALATMAQQRGITLVDFNAYAQNIIGATDANGFINVGGELIDTINPGNEPHHLNLDDGSNHGGTIGNGLLANGLFIDPVNAAFGAGLAPLSDLEMLQIADIAP